MLKINAFVSKMIAATSAEAPKGGSTSTLPKEGITGPMPDPALTTMSDGRTMGQVLNDLSRDDLKVAYEAINECYDIQWKKDGIEDLKNRLKALEDRVNEKVYKIAKVAMKHCENKMLVARPYFVSLCDQAETMKLNWYIKQHKEETTMAKMIPSWSTYKSQIAAGMEMGINPLETIPDSVQEDGSESPKYATASQYIAEVTKRQREAKALENATGSQAGNQRNTDGQTVTALTPVVSGWSPLLKAAMETMCKALNALAHEDQDTFVESLLQVAHDATALAATRPAKFSASAEPHPESEYAKQHPEEFKDGKWIGKPKDEVMAEELDPGTKAALQAAIDKSTKEGVASANVSPQAQKALATATEAHQGPTDSGKGKSGKKGPKAA